MASLTHNLTFILNAFQILSPEIAYDFSKKQMLFIK